MPKEFLKAHRFMLRVDGRWMPATAARLTTQLLGDAPRFDELRVEYGLAIADVPNLPQPNGDPIRVDIVQCHRDGDLACGWTMEPAHMVEQEIQWNAAQDSTTTIKVRFQGKVEQMGDEEFKAMDAERRLERSRVGEG